MGRSATTNMDLRLISLTLLLSAASATINLATWDGASATTFKFTELNDPVMGGQSSGTFAIDAANKCGIFDGEVKDVPSLKAPGFIKAAADGSFPDISSTIGGDLVLSVRSSTPEFGGFRVAFAYGTLSPAYACAGGGSIPLSRGCFKAKFSVAAGDEFSTVRIPLTEFSDMWSPATGEHTKECKDDADVCPTASGLKKLKRIEVWAEGALGKVHLEVQSIAAESAAVTVLIEDPPFTSSCSGSIQPSLRYNISRTAAAGEWALPVPPGATLAGAVCCDVDYKAYAEPPHLFARPDVQLFKHMNPNGTTTFYDSVCGLPVFVAPQGRSMADFEADTTEHGWPSFRPAELVQGNSHIVNATGEVLSKCGTHLGSFLPDSRGARWCLDLSCLSGNPKPVLQVADSAPRTVPLATFDGVDESLTHKWSETNDPVMGGASNGTFKVKQGVAVMDGNVNLIPRLQAPGFIKFETSDYKSFPDATGCKALSFVARSTTKFAGYRISIGTSKAPGGKFFANGFKAPFTAPLDQFAEVTIPFSDFSDFWDDATGKILHTCAEDARFCVDAKTLKNMSPITIWAEGAQGPVHLEVKSITASQCK